MKQDIYYSSIGDKKYRVIALSVKGEGKIENQDSYSISIENDSIIISLADGLGSATFSQEGSEKITKISTDLLKEDVDYSMFKYDLFKKWKDSIFGKLSLYDTTLKYIKVSEKDINYGGIGDGWIAILTENGVTSLESNNVFTNQTDTILDFEYKDKFKDELIDNSGFKVALLSTDGFSEDIDKKDCLSFLEDIFNDANNDFNGFVEELKSLLAEWPIETNKDDKTVIIIVGEL